MFHARRTTTLPHDPTAVPPSMRARREGRHGGAPTAAHPGPPSPELAGLLGHLRAALTRYVGGRRGAGAPLERVLAEVQELARAAATREGWDDPTDLLVPQATRWTLEAYAAGPDGGAHVPHGR